MKKPTHLLVVLDRSSADLALLAKAARLARRFDARLELFLCDAPHAYALKHEYEPSHSDEVRRNCMAQAIGYLTALQGTADLRDLRVSVSAACESPLYEGIVRKALASRPDLIIKNVSGENSPASVELDPNDWQLMRKCPVTLLMTRGRSWNTPPRFAAAVDVSAEETVGLARGIIETAAMLSAAHGSKTDVLYSESASLADHVRQTRAQTLLELVEQYQVNVGETLVLVGEPERTLPDALAKGNYDVLTLGALTHRPGAVTLVGTLTAKLVDTLDCDFVLVKPPSLDT
jgi:universal stress protein E